VAREKTHHAIGIAQHPLAAVKPPTIETNQNPEDKWRKSS
jgi:hypothetical protein